MSAAMPHPRLLAAVLLAALGVALITRAPSQTATTMPPIAPQPQPAPNRAHAVITGAERLEAAGFAPLAGKRVGLIANHTARIRDQHLADVLSKAPDVRLAAIFAPEHGFRGTAEAGADVGDAVDARTGAPIYSLYGATKAPTPTMLRNVDVLVFDIQDVGARFYTYVSTMGLAMRAAAAAKIPFLVLDRPNPLGGEYVSGFVLEPQLRSFVGQYPIPMAHGLTVGELALMIKGEGWLEGLQGLDLRVLEMQRWQRAMRWPQTRRPWVPTSPNIPSFASALVYPGMGLVGEMEVSEGRGTPSPFCLFGAPWLDAPRMTARLNALALPGLAFETATFTPRAIAGVASRPRFEDRALVGTRLLITDVAEVAPVELGIHVLTLLVAEARRAGVGKLFGNVPMFDAIAGTKRLYRMLATGSGAVEIIVAWQGEVARFRAQRARYLLY